MDTSDVSLMDRAYERRHELLGQPDVSWVNMNLDKHGVTLTICGSDNSKRVEFLGRSVEAKED